MRIFHLKVRFLLTTTNLRQIPTPCKVFFNKNNVDLHGIAVVYKKGYPFPELVLSSRKPLITINEDIQSLIKLNLVDLVVYGKKAPYDNCELFTNLCDDYANKQYILREFDNSEGKGKDRTLNRCSFDGIPFSPEKFKLGAPTPGGENDCSGAYFFLDQHLFASTSSNLNKAFDADNIDDNNSILDEINSPHCTSSFDASVYQNIDDNVIDAIIEEEALTATKSSCSSLNLGADSGNIANEADNLKKRKRRLSETAEEDEEWETTKYFK